MPKADATVEEFTEEDLAHLSDEERAALDYQEPDQETNDAGQELQEGQEAAKAEVDEATGQDGSGDDAAAAQSDQAPTAAAQDQAGAASGDDSAGQGQEAAAADDQAATAADTQGEPVPSLVEQINASFEEKIKAADEEQAGLGKLVSDGDLTIEQYHVKNKELGDQKIDLMRQRDDAIAWQQATDTFYEHPDNADLRTPTRMAFMNATLKTMAEAGEFKGMDYLTMIATAGERLRQEIGLNVPQGATEDDNKEKPERRGKKAPEIPKTLGDVPAADENLISDNKFAHLDRLQGEELEEAIARLSPIDQEAYLAQTEL